MSIENPNFEELMKNIEPQPNPEEEEDTSEPITTESRVESLEDNIRNIEIEIQNLQSDKLSLKELQENVRRWNDASPDDHTAIFNLSEKIRNKTVAIRAKIDQQFNLFEKEVKINGEVKSRSVDRSYKPEYIMDLVIRARQAAVSTAFEEFKTSPKADMLKQDIKNLISQITNTNKYRDRVSSLIDLILRVNDFKK